MSFNLLSMGKLTRTLNCGILFFPDYCLFQDLFTKRIIRRGRESRGLYIFDLEVLNLSHVLELPPCSKFIVA